MCMRLQGCTFLEENFCKKTILSVRWIRQVNIYALLNASSVE